MYYDLLLLNHLFFERQGGFYLQQCSIITKSCILVLPEAQWIHTFSGMFFNTNTSLFLRRDQPFITIQLKQLYCQLYTLRALTDTCMQLTHPLTLHPIDIATVTKLWVASICSKAGLSEGSIVLQWWEKRPRHRKCFCKVYWVKKDCCTQSWNK